MPGQLKHYAIGGTLFVLFLLGIGGFMLDFIPRYDSTAASYPFIAKTNTTANTLNTTLSTFVNRTQSVGTGGPLQSVYLLGDVIDLFKMPLTMANYLVDIVTSLFSAIGIPSPFAELIILLIFIAACWAFLDAAQGRDA